MNVKMRSKPSMPFAWLPQSIMQNPALSLKAKALWAYINSKPVGWNFSASRIAEETKEDRKAILRGIQELKDARLIEAHKRKNGRIEFVILDYPHGKYASIVWGME